LKLPVMLDMTATRAISMLETGVTKIPLTKAKGLARGYQVSESGFLKALLKTRYPEFWDAMLSIIANKPDIGNKPHEEINKEVDDFIDNIPKKV